MLFSKQLIKRLVAVFMAVSMPAFSYAGQEGHAGHDTSHHSELPALHIYKRATCGCCSKWISHIQDNGFQTTVENSNDLSALKIEKNIQPKYQSCHTAISKEGYVFEGHIPAKYIHQFLKEKPEGAIGLAVPAMPLGSPGMEVGDKFRAYAVLLLKADGSAEVYAQVKTLKEQY